MGIVSIYGSLRRKTSTRIDDDVAAMISQAIDELDEGERLEATRVVQRVLDVCPVSDPERWKAETNFFWEEDGSFREAVKSLRDTLLKALVNKS
jgi:hypothetical protein